MLWIQRLFVFLISGTIVNVWLFRSGQATLYRGGAAANLRDEFMTYGLNDTLFYLVGGLKLLAAVALLLGLVWKKNKGDLFFRSNHPHSQAIRRTFAVWKKCTPPLTNCR